MILRLNAAARLALVFVALALAAGLSYSSIRNAMAVHESNLATRQGYERSVRLEPGNPLNWFLLGRYWQYNLEEPDTASAIQSYRTSLSLDPRSAATWLDLAAAYESQGDLPATRDAFLQARRVYPLSAEVSWRYGNFLLRQQELPAAFAEIRQAIAVDPQLASEGFSRCWRVDPNIATILDQALPPDSSVYLDAIRELNAEAQMNPALAVWSRLVSIHPSLHLNDVMPFTDMLLFANRRKDARRVWDEAAALAGVSPNYDPPSSVLWDGGFESGVAGTGFAWSVALPSSGVQVAIDTKQRHSGRQSLQLGFDGKRNVNFADVCHIAVVQPETVYRFSAWVRTQDLTTDQGIRFRLDWKEGGRNAFIETGDTHGTAPWTRVDMPWAATAGVEQVRVCVARNPGDVFGSRIHGTAWIDDVALTPESGPGFSAGSKP
jgi:tetratricopeptide (TPR) repeat protein